MEFKWENIDGTTRRAKVVGGWLVETTLSNKIKQPREGGIGSFEFVLGVGVALTFVPDPNHAWAISDIGK